VHTEEYNIINTFLLEDFKMDFTCKVTLV